MRKCTEKLGIRERKCLFGLFREGKLGDKYGECNRAHR